MKIISYQITFLIMHRLMNSFVTQLSFFIVFNKTSGVQISFPFTYYNYQIIKKTIKLLQKTT